MSLPTSPTITSSSRGSPGPGERTTPSGRISKSSAAGVCEGNTRTEQPRVSSDRMMFRFTPPSRRTTLWRPSPVGVFQSNTWSVVTVSTQFTSS
jgi:hypothetical protein